MQPFYRQQRQNSITLPLRLVFWTLWILLVVSAPALSANNIDMQWQPQASPKEAIERNAAFIGVHEDMIIIAGGLGSGTKNSGLHTYLDSIWLGTKTSTSADNLRWQEVPAKLPSPRAFGATASSSNGAVLIGGSNGIEAFSDVLLLRANDSIDVNIFALPSLPIPMIEGSAAFVGNTLFVLVTKTSLGIEPSLYALDFDEMPLELLTEKAQKPAESTKLSQGWQKISSTPAAITIVSQNDGRRDSLFLINNSKNQATGSDELVLWQYNPNNDLQPWLRKASFDSSLQSSILSSSGAVALGQAHILVFTTNNLRTEVMSYNAITDAWAHYNKASQTQEIPMGKTLIALPWEGQMLVHEFDQTQNTANLWTASIRESAGVFGWQNMTVLIMYLFAMVMIGVYFVFKNKNVNDYFRGGQNIPWWANACSMYATMLSSLTFVGIPAIVYRTDWLYWVGIWMILAVTPIAAYVAMPFFRKIDATSAYEFLSLRFNMAVRLFASALFTLFHISRMGIVMALTALALAAVTPFDAWQCVLIIGVLSLIYCTLGGIEAVIWTDTIQTIVLLLGALLCFGYIVSGVDGGIGEIFRSGMENDKFRIADIDFSMDSFTKLSIWVIVLGGIGQNLSTYTADQSIVQRYMTTKDVKSARKSIWTNGLMAPVASVLFFAIGTGLYVFYQNNPEKLDPTKQLDQIFPAFISSELPIGIAGLIIAGIFAAAQSTVSTSMNSMSTTLVTDFMRPFNVCRSERAYLNAARLLTLLVGIIGTLVGLLFISPEIRSLMEEYFKIVGMFMGALGGLFILGIVSTKANAYGAIIGLFFGVGTMLTAWIFELTEGYLFGTIGIVSSILVGYGASLLFDSQPTKELNGLTIHTIK